MRNYFLIGLFFLEIFSLQAKQDSKTKKAEVPVEVVRFLDLFFLVSF